MESVTGLHERVVVGQDRAAFTRVQVLARLKAETSGLSVSADLAVAPLGQMRLTRVFNHRDGAPPANFEDSVQIGGGAAEMHRQYQLRASRDCSFDLTRVDLKRVDIGIREYRQRMHH